MVQSRIGIVGGGATSLYILKELLKSGHKLGIVIFEAGPTPGPGMPYSVESNADYMLCNAFSREIPIVTQSLVQWLRTLRERELNEWELSSNDVHARAFYPRVLIGEFLQNEFLELAKSLSELGCVVEVRSNSKVVDIGNASGGKTFVKTGSNDTLDMFDCVVIATGHVWSSRPMIENVPLLSPWPYTRVTELHEKNVGVLGSSLSAIDIVVALGFARGEFTEEPGSISWIPDKDQQQFTVTMISKMGIMPEGDFYYVYPYLPLKVITSEAVNVEVALGSAGLLQRVFNLLLSELDLADPGYLSGLGEGARTIDGFGKAYFQRRQQLGGLVAVEKDFAQVRNSMRDRQTIPHRYVLMRAHEEFDLALRALDAEDWKLFSEKLLPVFADCYAAVPHLSIARIIAMHKAGVLSLLETGEDAKFEDLPNLGVRVELDDGSFEFEVLIDARGQSTAPPGELPFPTLVTLLNDKEKPIEAPFKLDLLPHMNLPIYCVAMPQLLQRHPFSQGLQNCAEVAEIVVKDIVATLSKA